jgi:aminopeptidase
MPLDEMMNFFFDAVLQDWEKEATQYQQIQQVFQTANHVRIVGQGTDLSFSTKGRTYSIAAGYHNIPDGEIATAPIDDSAEGIITFEFPAIYAGRIIEGIQLEFSRGEVVNATAKNNQDFLHQIVNMDEGSRRIGEFGLGMNYKIDRYCHDLFYDEKIGGTTHIALGRAYAHSGGINQSSLHWDIVKDLRGQGKIYLDGQKVFENGDYLIP